MAEHTPTPWHWGNLYSDGSGPATLRGPKNEDVAVPYLDYSPEPGEGLDDWGLAISDEDAEFLTRAVNSHDFFRRKLVAIREALGRDEAAYALELVNAALAESE